jgi:nucleoside-diphosphate-sugar epimerase
MHVFVAGATGVLGSAAVRRLVAGGHEVTGIARGAAKQRALAEAGARAVAADIFDPAAVRAVVEGHDVVCNLTSHIPVGTAAVRSSAWRENDRIRTEGSAVLAKAAADCGALRFVQEGVAFVYADAGEAWITESSRLDPPPVTRSSVTAADNAMSFADEYRFAVVLRFGLLYGDDANTRWTLDRVRRGKPVLVGDPAGYMSPITVDDAAAAVLAALAAPSGVYNVAGTPVRREEYARALGTAAGSESSARFVSPMAMRLAGKKLEPLARSLRVSSDAFHTATGWRARTALAEGFASAVKASALK